MSRNHLTLVSAIRRFLPAWVNGPVAVVALAATLYALLYLAWLYFYWGDEKNVTLIADVTNLSFDVLTILAAWWVAAQRRLDVRIRRAWLIIGLSLISAFIADFIWIYQENFPEAPVFPSIAELFYFGAYPLIVWGLLTFPGRPLKRRERWQLLLDMVIVMTGAAMLVWYFIIQPAAAVYSSDLLTQVTVAAYPIGDLMVLGGIVAILWRRPDPNNAATLLLVLVGMLLFVVGDLAYNYTSLNGTYTTGGWVDAVLNIAHWFFILAALRQLYTAPGSTTESRWLSTIEWMTKALPFIVIGLAYMLVFYATQADNQTNIVWLLISVVLLTGLVLGRQIIFPSFANLSLRAKLILAFLGVTILSIGLVTLVINQVIRESLTDQVGTNLQALAQSKASQVAGLLDQQLDTLQTLVFNRGVQDRVAAAAYQYKRDPAGLQAQIQQLEQQWQAASDNDPLVQGVVKSPIIGDLAEFRENFPEHTLIMVTDRFGGLVAATQRPERYNHADEVWWQAAYNNGQGALYIGQPQLNAPGAAPTVTIAVPVRGHLNQEVIGVLRSVYSLASLQEILVSTQLGQTGHANLLLPNGQIIAAEEHESEVQDQALAQLQALEARSYAQFVYEGVSSLVGLAPVVSLEANVEAGVVQQLGWKLITHQTAAEALAPVNDAIQTALLTSLGALLLAGLLAFMIARRLVEPVTRLTAIAKQIAGGDLKAQAQVEATDEIGTLATAFNSMTGQLRQTLVGLENRNRSLEIIANLSERLSGILKLEELLAEVVNQVKEKFGYYHVHIYLLDQAHEKLVVAEGTGSAGAEMKARGHSIPLNAPTSLVARAARTGEIVKVDNVREAEDWLPNPLLPDTSSEMAVPITLGVEGQVVGVLDVQHDKIAGLDESDVNLLHSLANQVAIAIRNAGQFAEVEAALAEARALQQLYIAQSWDRTRITKKNVGRVQFSLGESTTLNETVIATARQQALASQEPTVVTFNSSGQASREREAEDAKRGTRSGDVEESDSMHHALVVPLKLRHVPVGDLQLHDIDPDRQWTEGELALINVVVDQVVQAAETLRLLDETQERASRQELISQITNKMRRAPDMETLMKVAVTELSRVLEPARTFVRLDSSAEVENDQVVKAQEVEPVEPAQPHGER